MTEKIGYLTETAQRQVWNDYENRNRSDGISAAKDQRGELGNFSSPVQITSAWENGKCKMTRLWSIDGKYQTRGDAE
jgi:hypothetical protein